jgi:hypothetical protein
MKGRGDWLGISGLGSSVTRTGGGSDVKTIGLDVAPCEAGSGARVMKPCPDAVAGPGRAGTVIALDADLSGMDRAGAASGDAVGAAAAGAAAGRLMSGRLMSNRLLSARLLSVRPMSAGSLAMGLAG